MNGAGPPDRAQPLDLSTLQGRTRAQTLCQSLIMSWSWVGSQARETFLATKCQTGN